MTKYEQLPLDGNENDHTRTQEVLTGTFELYKAVRKFYTDNKQYNPRQLHYYVTQESLDIHLNVLIGI